MAKGLYFNCNEPGHIRFNYPKRLQRRCDPVEVKAEIKTAADTANTRVVKSDPVPKVTAQKVYLRVEMNDHQTLSLLDTGCDKLLCPLRLESLDCRLCAANGTVIKVLGICEINAKVGSLSIKRMFIVTEDVAERMLSIDWPTKNYAEWNFEGGKINVVLN